MSLHRIPAGLRRELSFRLSASLRREFYTLPRTIDGGGREGIGGNPFLCSGCEVPPKKGGRREGAPLASCPDALEVQVQSQLDGSIGDCS